MALPFAKENRGVLLLPGGKRLDLQRYRAGSADAHSAPFPRCGKSARTPVGRVEGTTLGLPRAGPPVPSPRGIAATCVAAQPNASTLDYDERRRFLRRELRVSLATCQ